MRKVARDEASLGDLVVAAFDEAALYSSDPRVVSVLATCAVVRWMRRVEEARTRMHRE